MTDVPDSLDLDRHRDLQGLARVPWARWAVLTLLCAALLLGLLDVFGQRPHTSTASARRARLDLYAPEHLRGGLLFSARIHLHALQEIRNATLVFDPGWLEGMSVNTIEPSPVGEASRDGRLALQLGHVPKGGSLLLFMQFQVNPTNVAWRRSADVSLVDGRTPLLRIPHHFTIYP